MNWLRELDRMAKSIPESHPISNLTFGVARYPWMQSRTWVAGLSGEVAFYERFLAAERRMKRVLKGLSPPQRTQLASLIIDCNADLDDRLHVRATNGGREGQGYDRQLRKKSLSVRRHLEELRAYASTLGSHLGSDVESAAGRCLLILDRCKSLASEVVAIPPYFKLPSMSRRAELNMVKLYWFFRHECRLPGEEAEVRVALIRNHLWDYWVSGVKFQVAKNGATKSGCPAVRRAVGHFRNAKAQSRTEL